MKIAVTGSSGLIGSALISAIERRGDSAIRVVRGTARTTEIAWDINAGTIEASKLEGIDAVVHLAGAGIGDNKWTNAYKALLLESRTMGTSLICETIAALTNKPKVFVSGSAIGFYGDRGDQSLSEQDTRGSGFLSDLVVAWEGAASGAVDAGIRTALLRTGVVLSRDGGALKAQLPFFKLGIGGRIGDGTQYLSWIAIEDHVAAILHIIDSNISGPVNLTAPNPCSNAEFTTALGRAVGRPTFVPTPKFAVDLRLGKEAARELLFSSTRVLPEVLVDSGFIFSHPTIEEALEATL